MVEDEFTALLGNRLTWGIQVGLLVCALLTTGCTAAQRAALVPVPPEPPLPDLAERLQPPTLPADLRQAVAPPTQASAPHREEMVFTLADAVSYALDHSPRLEAARAAIDRAEGQEQAAFAPFLPQLDTLTRYLGTSGKLGPGAPGPTGGVVPDVIDEPYQLGQAELQLQWTLYDFGRTAGRHGQAVSHERIAEQQWLRAKQTAAFDTAVAFYQVLLASADREVAEEAVRAAEATLKDVNARRVGGVADRDDVLRADVQLSETRESLIRAEDSVENALARLNSEMGRPVSMPLRLLDQKDQPPLSLTLPQSLEIAAGRPEVAVAQEAVGAARHGRDSAKAEFCPRIYLVGSLGYVEGEHVVNGLQEGAGIHVNMPLYHGGNQIGQMRAAEADIHAALANARTILDSIALEVTIAHHGAAANQKLIALSRTAIEQARENLRLVRVKYRNGNATPTDIVDAETALTRSQQRNFAAMYDYLISLARLNYAIGVPPDPPPARAPAMD
jgi:outer membrane protein